MDITTIPDIGQKAIKNGIGSFIASQSDIMSDKYQRHIGKLNEIKSLNEMIVSESKIYDNGIEILTNKYMSANSEDRIRIRQDLEYMEGKKRQLSIYLKSLAYGTDKNKTTNEEPLKPIEGHWIDKFNELARKRNEEWRSDLLARALACEAETPNSVSPRAIWLMGHMEESLFIALSELLNLCVRILPDNIPLLPNSKIQALDRIISNSSKTVGNLVFQLADIGIVADHLTSSRQYDVKQGFIVKYEQTQFIITTKQKLEIRGILFTPLGDSIAKFFNPTWNSGGISVLNDWVESISAQADIQPYINTI